MSSSAATSWRSSRRMRADVLRSGGRARLSAAARPHVRRGRARRAVALRRLRRRRGRAVRRLRDAVRRRADRRGAAPPTCARPRPIVREHPAAHAREHSLEMQLPFLQRVAPDAAIVPLRDGLSDRRHGPALGEALAAVLAGPPRAPRRQHRPVALPRPRPLPLGWTHVVIDCVSRFDADGLQHALNVQPEHACGGGPTVAVMRAAELLGARDRRCSTTPTRATCLATSQRSSGTWRRPSATFRTRTHERHEDTTERVDSLCPLFTRVLVVAFGHADA